MFDGKLVQDAVSEVLEATHEQRVGYTPDMCIICVELTKQSMTPSEARRALREMTTKIDQAHIAKVEAKLKQAETDTAKP